MSSKTPLTSGGLKVKSTTESQAPVSGGAKLEKASSLKEVLEKPNTRYTYAIVRARRNVVVSVINKNGFIKINITTMIGNRAIAGFDARLVGRIVRALNDLYNDLTSLNPDISKEKSGVREY
jgi:hypothetical protein